MSQAITTEIVAKMRDRMGLGERMDFMIRDALEFVEDDIRRSLVMSGLAEGYKSDNDLIREARLTADNLRRDGANIVAGLIDELATRLSLFQGAANSKAKQ